MNIRAEARAGRVRALHTELHHTDLMAVIDATLARDAPGYSLVEYRHSRHPDRAYIAARKGDTYITWAVFLGERGYGRQREYVGTLEWGHYGLSRRTYGADLARRVT